jgi:5-methyltetrahydrofolate--homocysteine methyltransferase
MVIPNLTIIGERINPGFPISKKLIDNRDIDGLAKLAVSQVRNGAGYLTINTGENPLERLDFLQDLILSVQNVVDVPLSFDSPDPLVQEICLKVYDPEKAKGRKPIVNSVNEQRWEMLDLLKIQPFRIIIMASERFEDGQMKANRRSADIAETARHLVAKITDSTNMIGIDDIYIDVSLGPLASDSKGLTGMAVYAIKQIGTDPALRDIHMIVGLSNLSIMLPNKAIDGSLLKVQIDSAFLTRTMPYGLDTILGTPGRDYRILHEDNFVLKGFDEAISLGGFDSIIRIQQLYRLSDN